MPHCSVPRPFKKWFDARFSDLCDWHDEQYVKRVWADKVVADFVVTAEFAKRGYIWLAFGSIPYFAILGTTMWVWKKYLPLIKYSRIYAIIGTIFVLLKNLLRAL